MSPDPFSASTRAPRGKRGETHADMGIGAISSRFEAQACI